LVGGIMIKKKWWFKSSISCPTNPPHITTINSSGSMKCSCPGWNYRDQHRCIHTRLVLSGVADKAAIKFEVRGKTPEPYTGKKPRVRKILWDKPKRKAKRNG